MDGLDNFRKEYISLMQDRDVEAHKKMVEYVGEMNELARKSKMPLPLIQGFDLAQPNYIVSDSVMKFLRVDDTQNSKLFGFFVSEQELLDYLDYIDNEKSLAIIKYFGLRGKEKQSLQKIADTMGISKQAVSAQINTVRKNWKKQLYKKQMQISDNGRQMFIKLFFQEYDIFTGGIELSQSIKETLAQTYQDGIKEKKQQTKRERERLKRKYKMNPRNVARRLQKGEKIYISELGLSMRAENALINAGYDTLNALLDISDLKDLIGIPSLGKVSIKNINDKLTELGLILGGTTLGDSQQIVKHDALIEEQIEENITIGRLNITRMTREILENAGFYDLKSLICASREKVKKLPKNEKVMGELHDLGIYFYWENKPVIENQQISQINELGLKNRTLQVLVNAGYVHIKQLCDIENKIELFSIKGIGTKGIQDLESKMHLYGFFFQWETEKTEPIPEQNKMKWLFEQIFGTSINENDLELQRIIEALFLARQELIIEKELCDRLGKPFGPDQIKKLQLIETIFNEKNIELR